MAIPVETVSVVAEDSGERRLNQLGYRQSLRRELSKWGNFCFTVSLLATPLTITALYTVGFYNGGPVAIIYGWLVVSFFTMFVVLSMAEILSSLPTAGGIYYQSYYLGGERWGPLACWWTGWLDWLAYVSGIAAVNFIFAQLVSVVILLSTGFNPPPRTQFGISCLAAFIELLLNLFPIRILGTIQTIGAVWVALLSLLLCVLLPLIAPTHQSFSFVFSSFNDNTLASGLGSPVYLWCLGLLMSQFSLTGFDVSGHISEETKRSDLDAAWTTVTSVLTAIVGGFAILVAITFSIQDPNNVLNPDNLTQGAYAAPQIYYDVFFARFGSGVGASVLIACLSLCCLFGNTGGTAAGSRLFWSMSRDGATPFSSLWTYLTPHQKVPLYAMLVTVVGSVAFTVPVCFSSVAFTAINSFTTIATYLAYGMPILMKLTFGRRKFEAGPLCLGRFSFVVNVVALVYIAGIAVVFCLPTLFPVNLQTLNYTPLVFGAVFVLVTIPWLLPKKYFNFKGPVSNLTGNAEEYSANPLTRLICRRGERVEKVSEDHSGGGVVE